MLTNTHSFDRPHRSVSRLNAKITENIVPCWILEPMPDQFVAIGELEIVHLLQQKDKPHNIPMTPPYARSIILWQGIALPIIDLAVLLGMVDTKQQANFLAVVAYNLNEQEAAYYGAFSLQDIPRRVMVSDEDACDFPDDKLNWCDLAHSCISYQEQIIPILQLQHIFATQLMSLRST